MKKPNGDSSSDKEGIPAFLLPDRWPRRHFFSAHEKPQSRRHFHSDHGHARHDRDRIDRSGAAETDSRFSRRQYDERRELERLVRIRIRDHAVWFFAAARRSLG